MTEIMHKYFFLNSQFEAFFPQCKLVDREIIRDKSGILNQKIPASRGDMTRLKPQNEKSSKTKHLMKCTAEGNPNQESAEQLTSQTFSI